MNALLTRGGLFDDFFRDVAPGFYIKPLHGDGLPNPSQIKVDVRENNDAYTIHAEIPGVSKEEIQVAVDGNVVTLRAEVKQQDSLRRRVGPLPATSATASAARCGVAQLPVGHGH